MQADAMNVTLHTFQLKAPKKKNPVNGRKAIWLNG